MKSAAYTILTLIAFQFTACKKLIYYPDVAIDIQNPKLIAHRGGRSAVFRENTLQGIKAALRHKDGIEVDVQLSKSETIWLSHSVDVIGCHTRIGCFPAITDAEIRNITTCNGLDISYTELDSVYKFVKDSFPNAVICIDLKGWFPCHVNSLDIEGIMKREAEILIKIAEKYQLSKNTLLETEASSVLLHVKKLNPRISTYQVAYGDFERAMLICLDNGFNGISFKINIKEPLDIDKMNLIHRKGLKLIAWNLKDSTDIAPLKAIGVDYIQMDL